MILTYVQYENTIETALEKLEQYIRENGLQGVALGVSGGLDSALMAYLTNELAERLNRGGYSFRAEYWFLDIESKPSDFQKARDLAQQLGVRLDYQNLNHLLKDWSSLIDAGSDHHGRVRQGNIKARLRNIFLRDRAQALFGYMGETGNWSEHIVGFWTIGGDQGDLGVLGSLTKSEIHDLARVSGRVSESILRSKAGDGLGVTKKGHASDQLGDLTHLYRDYLISRFLKVGFDHLGSPDQLLMPKYQSLAHVVAREISATSEQVLFVMGKVAQTAFKRRLVLVRELMPSRIEIGLPIIGSQGFNNLYLAAIQKELVE